MIPTEFGGEFLDALEPASSEREPGAGSRESPGRLSPDAARSTRDDGVSAREVRHAPELIVARIQER